MRHFVAVGNMYNFSNFLENKSRYESNKYTTFINSSWGISEQNMREVNFSSMCRIFVLSRGLRGHSLLTIGSCFSVHYRVMEHLGSLESTKEA